MLDLCFPTSLFNANQREKERNLWARLWDGILIEGVVMEELTEASAPRPVGFMAVALVLPELHDRLVKPGGPALLEGLATEGEHRPEITPSEREIGMANASSGIDSVFCWVGYDESSLDGDALVGLRSRVVSAFNDLYQGNRVRRVTIETDNDRVLQRFFAYGYQVIRQEDGRTVMSMHRSFAMGGSDLSSQRLFSYDPPVLGFTAAQRAILLLARQGYTDQEVSAFINKSPDSVKKRWSGIYARFAQVFPGRLPTSGEGLRGTEKRRTLLAYLRDRPEELRPYFQAAESDEPNTTGE